MKKRMVVAILTCGFIAMAAQIVFLRELFVVFAGNELAIGLALASWLLCGGIGSWLFSMLSAKIRGRLIYATLLAAIGLYLPLGIACCGLIRSWLGLVPGEIAPLPVLGISSLLVLLPLSAGLGFLFGLSCKLLSEESGIDKSAAVYGWEAAGSLIGGLVTSFIFTRYFTNLEISCLLGTISCFAAALLLIRRNNPRPAYVPVILGLWLLLPFTTGTWAKVETMLLSLRWPGYSVAFNANSIYGTRTVLTREGQVSYLSNGVQIASVPDRMAAEDVHLCLLEHPDPKSVLLIGGGSSGALTEILKHPVETIDYLELDPLAVETAEKFLPETLRKEFKDPRVHIHTIDARFFVEHSSTKYDCVILALGEPYTALINRYYTKEFFSVLMSRLNDDAIVYFGMPGSESFLNSPTRDFLACVYATLKSSFPKTLVIPGETARFLAGMTQSKLSDNVALLERRAKERSSGIAYMREYYLAPLMSRSKIQWMDTALSGREIRVNRDFQPSAYHYGLISWFSRFRSSITGTILSANRLWLLAAFSVLLGLMLALGFAFKRTRALLAVMVIGFGSTSLQIILLYAFQVIHGYLYVKLGLLLTAFMAGLGLGALIAPKNPDPRLIKILFLVSVVLCCRFPRILKPGTSFEWLSSNILFPGLGLIYGTIAAVQFILLTRAYSRQRKEERVSTLYSLDLIGASLGAALTAVFLIPVAGLTLTCLLIAASYLCAALFI